MTPDKQSFDKKTKIGFLIPEFPGQTHSFFWREIKLVVEKYGCAAEVISTRRPKTPAQHEWIQDINVLYLFPPGFVNLVTMLWCMLRHLPNFLRSHENRKLMISPRVWGLFAVAMHLGRQCRALKVEHLHVHSCADSALLAAICHQVYEIPYSIVLHGHFQDYGEDQKYKWQFAEFVFVITQSLRRIAISRMPEFANKIYVVPMGVDTDVFAPQAKNPHSETDTFFWFCCARLHEVKGFDTLLPAAVYLKQNHPDLPFQIQIAGEDNQDGQGYRKELERIVAENDLQDTAFFLGAIPQKSVRQWLLNCDGFVLASHQEPLGVAYMEAMSCAKPTVGTNAGGVSELIEDEINGMLVPPRNAKALAEAMHRIMVDPDLRVQLGEKARQKIVDSFSSDRSARELIKCVAQTQSERNNACVLF